MAGADGWADDGDDEMLAKAANAAEGWADDADENAMLVAAAEETDARLEKAQSHIQHISPWMQTNQVDDFLVNCKPATVKRIHKVMMMTRDPEACAYLRVFKAEVTLQNAWLEAEKVMAGPNEFLVHDALRELVGQKMEEWEMSHIYNADKAARRHAHEERRLQWQRDMAQSKVNAAQDILDAIQQPTTEADDDTVQTGGAITRRQAAAAAAAPPPPEPEAATSC